MLRQVRPLGVRGQRGRGQRKLPSPVRLHLTCPVLVQVQRPPHPPSPDHQMKEVGPGGASNLNLSPVGVHRPASGPGLSGATPWLACHGLMNGHPGGQSGEQGAGAGYRPRSGLGLSVKVRPTRWSREEVSATYLSCQHFRKHSGTS